MGWAGGLIPVNLKQYYFMIFFKKLKWCHWYFLKNQTEFEPSHGLINNDLISTSYLIHLFLYFMPTYVKVQRILFVVCCN